MKVCNKCGKERFKKDFYKKSYKGGRSGYYNWCKACHYKMCRLWRENNIERFRGYGKKADKKRYTKRSDFLQEQKNKPCDDCGNTYPHYIMEFDHVRGRKKSNISSYIRVNSALLEEIKKCDVVCANCHRKRTHERRVDDA